MSERRGGDGPVAGDDAEGAFKRIYYKSFNGKFNNERESTTRNESALAMEIVDGTTCYFHFSPEVYFDFSLFSFSLSVSPSLSGVRGRRQPLLHFSVPILMINVIKMLKKKSTRMTRDGVDWQHCWNNYLFLVRIADGNATASEAQIEQRTGHKIMTLMK